jgi:IS30 family transposase
MKKRKTKKKKKSAPQFSFAERVKIETYLGEKKSKHEIARNLKREPSSVRYEIRLNSVRGVYTAEKAQVKAYQRRWRAKHQVLKVAVNKMLKDYVTSAIKQYWSPEAIVGRIKYIDRHVPRIGKDAIYAFLESVHGRKLEEYLWLKGKKCKRKVPRVTIDGRTMIDKRPKNVAKRRHFGHWEGDFIVSGKSGSGALLVLVERTSRYVIIRRLHDRSISTVNGALASIFGGGQLVIDSLTVDNDISFRKHEEMSVLIGAPVFFCHPYHSWEKGSVEKMNQLIRRFVSKGCDVSKVSTERIEKIERILNNRPLKCLRFLTPCEVMSQNKKLSAFVAESSWSKYYQFTNLGWVK